MTLKNSVRVFAILLAVVHSAIGFAQNISSADVSFSIPEVALIDIEPSVNNTINFEVVAPPESGDEPVVSNSTNEDLWLNYTSAQAHVGSGRSISAMLSENVPDGISLYVRASKYSGIGDGVKAGKQTKAKKLTQNPVTIVRNIKNFYTGNGVGNGHQLTFTMEITDIEAINSTSNANFVVTYTLTDN